MSDRVVVSAISVPVHPRRLNPEAGLRIFHLTGSQCLIGWVEGQRSFRAGVLDLDTGELSGAAPITGALTAFLADDRVLWLLTSYGLQEVDRGTFTVRRSVQTGLPKHPSRLLRVAPHHALVVSKYGQSHPIIDLHSMGIAGRVRVPEPSVSVPMGDAAALLSLRYGIRRRLTPDMKLTGGADTIPRGIGAIHNGDNAVLVTATPKPTASIVVDAGLDAARYVDVAPTGTLAWVGATGNATIASEPAGVSWIHGATARGDLVCSDGSFPDGITRLSVLASDGYTLRASHAFTRKAGMIAVLPNSAVLSSPSLFGDPRSELELIRW